jgi:hypothetical protein
LVHRLKPQAHLLYAGQAGKLAKLVLRAQYTVFFIRCKYTSFSQKSNLFIPIFFIISFRLVEHTLSFVAFARPMQFGKISNAQKHVA